MDSSSLTYASSQMYCLRLNKKQRALTILNARSRKKPTFPLSKSVLEPNVSGNGNGTTAPTRILLEQLFAQTQKLEEQMGKDFYSLEDGGFSFKVLESELQNALITFRKKEEDLQNAERAVLLEYAELDRTKQELEQRQDEIAAAYSRHEKIEEDLKKANDDLVSQARQIEDLKLLVEQRDREISSTKSILDLREEELKKLRDELVKKYEEAKRLSSDLESRDHLLEEANSVIKKQVNMIHELQRSVEEKEQELAAAMDLQKAEEGKLKIAESNLEKRTVEWMLQQEALQKLADEALKHMNQTGETLRGFEVVERLLADVSSELASTKEILISSRRKMEDQELELEKQLAEINELKVLVTSYTENLRDAQLEVKGERNLMQVELARNKELEDKLLVQEELVRTLEEDLNKERAFLEEVTREKQLLREQLEQKTREFDDAQNLLEATESELVQAKMQIQHLISVQMSLQHILEERDADFSSAERKLVNLDKEAEELKGLMNSKEKQLIEATVRLQEEQQHMLTMQHELNDTKLKFSEALDVVGRIARLTNELAISAKDDHENITFGQVLDKPVHDFEKQQLKTELEMMKESLRTKEMEVMGMKRALAIKEEELNVALERLNTREQEMKEMKEDKWKDVEMLREMNKLVEEKFEGKSVGELAVEKLQLEAAQLEVEAATTALRGLAELSGELLKETHIAMNFHNDIGISISRGSESGNIKKMSNCMEVAQKEVAHLASLTEKLVKEAVITSPKHQGTE